MKNKIEDLRNHLFQQLERLNDDSVIEGDGLDREIKRAKAMSEVAKTLTDSARVEVDFLKMRTNSPRLVGARSDFIESTKALPAPAFDGQERNP